MYPFFFVALKGSDFQLSPGGTTSTWPAKQKCVPDPLEKCAYIFFVLFEEFPKSSFLHLKPIFKRILVMNSRHPSSFGVMLLNDISFDNNSTKLIFYDLNKSLIEVLDLVFASTVLTITAHDRFKSDNLLLFVLFIDPGTTTE